MGPPMSLFPHVYNENAGLDNLLSTAFPAPKPMLLASRVQNLDPTGSYHDIYLFIFVGVSLLYNSVLVSDVSLQNT